MSGKHESMAEIEPFPIMTATVTQMAQHYRVCAKTFMRKIDPILHKLSSIAKRRGRDGKMSPGRYPSLSPREVQYIVEFMEIRDREGY